MIIGQTNITTTVVGQTLGISAHNVSALCTSNNINMLNINKPTFKSSGANWQLGEVNSEYYEGITTYSITKPYSTSIWNGSLQIGGAVIAPFNNSGLKNCLTNWTYKKPVGGITSPFRLGDFRGYNNSSPSYQSASTNLPIVCYFNQSQVSQQYTPSVVFRFQLTDDSTNSFLGLNKLFDHNPYESIKKYYFGLNVVTTNDGVIRTNQNQPVSTYYINPTPITENDTTINTTNVFCPISTSNNPNDKSSKFIEGENVYVIPFILIHTNVGYYVFTLGVGSNPYYSICKIAATSIIANFSVSLHYTDYKRTNNADGSSHIWIRGAYLSVSNLATAEQTIYFSPAYISGYLYGGTYSQLDQKSANISSFRTLAANESTVIQTLYDEDVYIKVNTQNAVTITLTAGYLSGTSTTNLTLNVSIPAGNH